MKTGILYFVAWLCLQVFPVAAQDTPRTTSADGAAVGFADLSNGDVVPSSFIVKFTISGMGIAPPGVEIENTGHPHLLIDLAQLPPMDKPLPALQNIRHFGEGQSQMELQLPEGEHSLQLLLADHAHVPHDPPVMSEVIAIVVSADAPAETETQE